MRALMTLAFRGLLALALLVLTPLSFSPADGVTENSVCGREAGSDTCVRELDSICTNGKVTLWDYYNSIGE